MGAIRRTSALYVVACLDSLFAVSSRLLIWGCHSECRATHNPRNMIIPGLLVLCGAEVATRFPRAGRRSVSLLAAPQARPAAIRPLAALRHVSITQAVVTPTNRRFLTDLSKVRVHASSSLTNAFRVPLKGILVRDTFTPVGNSGLLLLLLLPPRWGRRPISPSRLWGRDGGLIQTHRLRRGKQSQVSLYFPLRISPRPVDLSSWSHGYHQSWPLAPQALRGSSDSLISYRIRLIWHPVTFSCFQNLNIRSGERVMSWLGP